MKQNRCKPYISRNYSGYFTLRCQRWDYSTNKNNFQVLIHTPVSYNYMTIPIRKDFTMCGIAGFCNFEYDYTRKFDF